MNRGGYATGTRSGIRSKDRPNWRQVQAAKKKQQEKEKEKKKEKRMEAKRSKQEEEILKEHKRWEGEKLFAAVRMAKRMYSAGWNACAGGDAFATGWITAFRTEGLYDSALSEPSSSFFGSRD